MSKSLLGNTNSKGHVVSAKMKKYLSNMLKGKYAGEKSCNAKLSNIQRVEIYNLFKQQHLTHGKIAKIFNVSRRTIGNSIKFVEKYKLMENK
jgi:DNA-binding transcriptional regulator YiaG